MVRMRILALRTVLVATDLDEASMPAVEAARMLATAAGAVLHVVTVAPRPGQDDPDAPAPPLRARAANDDQAARAAHRMLQKAGIALDEAAVHALVGEPTHIIGAVADEIQADVVVLGPHRETDPEGQKRRGLGTAIAVATNSAAPCLVARKMVLPLTHVVVADDLSDTSRGALRVGLSWASALRASRLSTDRKTQMTALLVVEPNTSPDEIAKLKARLEDHVEELRSEAGSWANVTVRGDVVVGAKAAEAIARYSEEHDVELLVLGTRGLGLDTVGRLGSVAADVAHTSNISTLLVPPAVWLELASDEPPGRPARKSPA